MASRLMAKRLTTGSLFTSSPVFGSLGRQPCFQLLNDTKVLIADKTRFFFTAPKAKSSILEGTNRYSTRFFSTAPKAKSSILEGTNRYNTRFFSTAPKAKPSILEEFLAWVREKQSTRKCEIQFQMSSRGLEIWVNVAGFGKDDMKVEIENGKLMINGVAKDRMGKTVRIKERMCITDFPFIFDPENVLAETRSGLLKVCVPFSENEEDKKKEGRFSVKWI